MRSRRDFLTVAAAGVATGLTAWAAASGRRAAGRAGAGSAAVAASGVIHDGASLGTFGIDPNAEYPDVRSYRKKLGLIVPVTNTSMEHELWSLVFGNYREDALRGVGLHTVNVVTPRPKLETEADLLEYKRQFVSGLGVAVDQARLAEPHHLVMGMSLEHILTGIGEIRDLMASVAERSPAPWATWHDAAPAALRKLGAKRIGLLTPFDALGNANARRMFEDLGFEVVSTFGFACPNAVQIAHVPDAAKERAIREHLATKANRLDAVVQCGTNMSMLDVTERLEPELGIPILGINAVTFWHAVRAVGIAAPLVGGGRLLREA